MRICSRCLIGKPHTEFYPKRHRHAREGLQGTCKQCSKELASKWVRENTALHNINTARWAKKNKAKQAAAIARWGAANTHKRNAHFAERRAMKAQACPAWANKFFIEEIYDLARLRTQYTGVRHEVDHIVPLKSSLVCGLHVEHNLQVIPAIENRKKHNRTWPGMPAPAAEVRA